MSRGAKVGKATKAAKGKLLAKSFAKPKPKPITDNIDDSGYQFDHTGDVKLVYYNEIRLKMVREANKNPAFATLLAGYEPDDWGGIIGEIAAFFNMEMDGAYTEPDLDKVSEDLYWRLVGLNKVTVVDIAVSKGSNILH